MAVVIAASGVLSALLANDIVCLAIAPLLVEALLRRGLDPRPHLLALACASNIGSAATLIGNPQNMLIGQSLRLSFAGYLLDGGVPAGIGLLLLWLWLRKAAGRPLVGKIQYPVVEAPDFNPWQAAKGLAILLLLVTAFLLAPWPREVLALAAGGVILLSRRMHSRRMLGLVDWQLLVLFIGLFVVNHALAAANHVEHALAHLNAAGIDVTRPTWLFATTAVLSNLVSNVPAVMLLLPAATHPAAGPILALASTLAGNLLIVGSIANIIVVEQAGQLGVRITWRDHARVGVPVTLLTLAVAAAWLAMRIGA
jgi:Na+/H+ antiporter NhaD/arsenite permease-like protein